MYLARRFPGCQLWWPTVAEDITVNSLTTWPGKTVLLEVKTTDWSSRRHEHRLTLDVDQLRAYQKSAVPVYYVFPVPGWNAVLKDAHPWLGGQARCELLDPGPRCFTGWTFVVSARSLWSWLGWRQRQRTATFFTLSGGIRDPSRVYPRLAPWWSWATFWDVLSRCGTQEMPAMVTVPAGSGPSSRGTVNRRSLAELLAALQEQPAMERHLSDVERYVPTYDNDGYQLIRQLQFPESHLTAGGAGRSTALLQVPAADLFV